MAAEFLEEEEALVLLTHEQSMLLARMRRDPRMVIRGCAGSGKTMLAVEHGKHLAAEGKRVLLVCFNRGLRDHLRETSAQKGLTIQNFHSLCVQLANEAKLKMPSYPKGEAPQRYWDEELPDGLVEAIAQLGDRFDAVLVDEAQDLRSDWLAALLCTLRDEDNDPVWLFMDDNQRVYEPLLEVPPEFRPFDLTVNCRNTRAVHREVMKLYEGDVVPEVKGPPGRDPELYTTDDPAPTVARAIARLHEREEVPLQDIVVLSSHGYDNCEVRRKLPGRYPPTNQRGKNGRHVFFSSIRAFKGLESPVVILCELEDLDDMTQSQQLYVAVSRARNHVVVVAPTTP
jgi:superfamily I DNA/RNA helicase